jgi:6-phosphogluconolactonase
MRSWHRILNAHLLGVLLASATLGCKSAPPPRPDKEEEEPPLPERAFVYVGGYDSQITILSFDRKKGALTRVGTAPAGEKPAYLAFHPSGDYLYAADEVERGKVHAFEVDEESGELTALNTQPSGGAGAVHLSVTPSGKWLLVANYHGGSASVLPISDDGRLGQAADEESPGELAHMIIPDPNGKHVFVPCKGSDHVAQYRLDEETGDLAPNDVFYTARAAAPRHMAFHPSGRFAYLLGEADNTIITLRYDGQAGKLDEPVTESTLPAEFNDRNSTAHILVAPSGNFVYMSNRGHDSIGIFAVDKKTGAVTLVGHETGGGQIKKPRNFTLDPSGRWLLVANQASDTVMVFAVNKKTGMLKPVGPAVGVEKSPSFVGVLVTREAEG